MLTLTAEQIADLVRPLKQPAAQARHLRQLGYVVERRPDGGIGLVYRPQYDAVTRPANGPKWRRKA